MRIGDDQIDGPGRRWRQPAHLPGDDYPDGITSVEGFGFHTARDKYSFSEQIGRLINSMRSWHQRISTTVLMTIWGQLAQAVRLPSGDETRFHQFSHRPPRPGQHFRCHAGAKVMHGHTTRSRARPVPPSAEAVVGLYHHDCAARYRITRVDSEIENDQLNLGRIDQRWPQ